MNTFKEVNMTFKQLFNLYIFVVFIAILSAYLITQSNIDKMSYIVISTFILNGVIIFFNLCIGSKKGYSLNDIFWVFMFIFMFVAPLIQYINNHFPWWDQELLTDYVILETNIVITIFLITYFVFNNKRKKKSSHKKHVSYEFKNLKQLLNILFYLSILISLYIINNVGISNMFFRGTAGLNLDQTNMLIVSKSLRAFPFLTLILMIIYKKKFGQFQNKYHFIIIVILFIITHFPTGLPRYQIAGVYLALIVTIFYDFKNKYLVKSLILVGLLAIFPLINIFRRGLTLDANIQNPMENFLKGDYDAYSMISRAILFVNDLGITNGKQLFTAIFFFVPRTLWEGKSIGSGALMANHFEWIFNNVSSPIIAEAYINFSYAGVILFAAFLGSIFSYLDNKWGMIHKNNISAIKLYYPILIGFIFFVLRGDLLSSVAYTFGYIIPITFIIFLDYLLQNLNKKGFKI